MIIGPLTRSGMDEAGTLQEVRDFMALVADVRERAGRRVAFMLVHHENKGGQVSGAWEGAGDTLLHVTGQGHGRTRLYFQKARWSSAHHATALEPAWADGEGFAVDDSPELDDDTLAEQILAFIGENPGTGWAKVEKATPGIERPAPAKRSCPAIRRRADPQRRQERRSRCRDSGVPGAPRSASLSSR